MQFLADNLTEIIAVVTGAIGGLGAWIAKTWLDNKNADTDNDQRLIDTIMTRLDKIEAQNDQLRKENGDLRAENAALKVRLEAGNGHQKP